MTITEWYNVSDFAEMVVGGGVGSNLQLGDDTSFREQQQQQLQELWFWAGLEEEEEEAEDDGAESVAESVGKRRRLNRKSAPDEA